VDGKEFPFIERPARNCFTFGSVGYPSRRKGIDILLHAFQDEFGAGDAVRLLLRGSSPPENDRQDERVMFVSEFLNQEQLRDLLFSMDAFVLPSRGEGFGLTALEAMATGLPTIATNWSGPPEYLDPLDSFPLDYHLVDAGGALANGVAYHGQWAEPDYEHLRFLLRWLYENPKEAAARGRLASKRILAAWTWERAAVQLVKDLDALMG
jgi:glycosyltransferase involved in cell wall biosynthesis